MNTNKSFDAVAVSLFSGCGGLDIGSELAGVPVIYAIDNNEDCVATLKTNRVLARAQVHHADVATLPLSSYEAALGCTDAKKFIVIGGPPCQPFSKAGYWVGLDARLGFRDPRNMIGDYLRVVSGLRPDGFLFENVESLMHPANTRTVEFIISTIQRLGYHHKLIRANALDYGVPQRRKRVFILASKSRFNSHEPRKTHCPPEDCDSTGLPPHEGVLQHIGRFDTSAYFEPSEVTSGGRYAEELRAVPPGKNYLALTARAGHPTPRFRAGTRFWSFLLKLHPELSSWTIAAQPGPWVGPFHWTSRRLRVPEIAALQMFPEDFRFFGNRRSIQTQIGNAVPPPMAKAMIEFLKENL